MFGLCALGYADEHFPFLAQVSKASVNIRAGANMNFEKLDKINRGAEIVVWGRSFDWYKIQLPITAQAYIRADYLQIRQHLMAEITGDKVHIRARANSDSASLGQLKKGDLVKVIAQTNGWYQIEPPAEAVGWIYKDFLSVKSLTVEPSFIRGPLRLPAQPKSEPPSMPGSLEVKGRS
ncbi:MAG: SH3 domain-containing protein [Candidatus Omnitrophica bacterium]|nr:SH3 domain-containing protein [Candidatus Omnitrophota bacterium]